MFLRMLRGTIFRKSREKIEMPDMCEKDRNGNEKDRFSILRKLSAARRAMIDGRETERHAAQRQPHTAVGDRRLTPPDVTKEKRKDKLSEGRETEAIAMARFSRR